MLKPQLHTSDPSRALLLSQKSPFFSNGTSFVTVWPSPGPSTTTLQKYKKGTGGRVNVVYNSPKSESSSVATTVETIAVKAVATMRLSEDLLGEDLLGKTPLMELVSSEEDQTSVMGTTRRLSVNLEQKKVQGYTHKVKQTETEVEPLSMSVQYEYEFQVSKTFGEIGAIKVENEHHKGMYLKNIVIDTSPNNKNTVIDTSPNNKISFDCNTWIAPKASESNKRIFFTNKSYLPSETPSGLKKHREEELAALRGDGKGERKDWDRIYDYDLYNDLGDPDESEDMARPVLGGPTHPYPRRCRTGRGPTIEDPSSEKRSSSVYVPRDETFSEVKESELHALLPSLMPNLVDSKPEGVDHLSDDILPFETPHIIERDTFAWIRDEEFSRQTLAGLNPFSIQLIREWPLKSTLDPSVYGPPESAIKEEHIEQLIKGVMTFKEAYEQKRLFMLDYHDLYLPYVAKVRELEGTTLYGSRTIFFRTENGTLTPLLIELTRPATKEKQQWKQVFTSGWDATTSWLWKFAKAHVTAHDAGYHQLVIHWLRTHCCMEPYIIACHRQLSSMHPIYRLLHPHFRYTMKINALSRERLINANGIIENCFAPGKYSIELSSDAYNKLWRFDTEALPDDLIKRGLAVEDPEDEYRPQLLIEDYPFANDGLVLWDTIKTWVSDYVKRYYPEAEMIESDTELQAFWTEVRTQGHADKQDEPWWPILNTQDNLIKTLTTIIWVGSGHHAAVNFGQYQYGSYRPTIVTENMPCEDPDETAYKHFVDKPETTLLNAFPSQIQATKVKAVLYVLSTHSSDEEYIGDQSEPSWTEDPIINAAFKRFNRRLKELEWIIDGRNADPKLLNRTGAGVVPYKLLKPVSKPGVTGMGVPNSISI